LQGDFRIGDWMIQPRINSIEHDGSVIHLEPKVMQVLVTLAAERGEVVTREQLRAAVWPNVFVGDDVLIRAISEIRKAFQDDPRSSHTIQTVPKVGYRLIAPVSEIHFSSSSETPLVSAPSREQIVALPEPKGAHSNGGSSDFHKTRISSKQVAVAILTAIALLGFGAFLLLRTRHSPIIAASYTSHPLTTYPGSQLQPSFSPDGNAIAFVWHKPGERNGHVYVKTINSEESVRLTSSSDEELNPVWSPDGHAIALIRHSQLQSSVEIVPSLGGSERQVYSLPVNSVWEYGGLTWSSDGERLIFPQQITPGGPSELVELTLEGHTVRQLTSPPAGWDGDWMPAVSPDGKMLSFVRGSERSIRDIYVMALPNGTPHRLTSDDRLIIGTAWSADGTHIIFSSNRGGTLALWSVPIYGGAPEREPVGTDDAYAPTIARRGDRLAYCHGDAAWSISAIGLSGGPKTEETVILTSSEQDAAPAMSPAGNKLAFQSWRSGAQEIWISGIDGGNPVQLTNTGADDGSPAWSPNGQWIAFDARPDGFAHIYVMDASGGSARVLTSGRFNDIVPSWSADGQWIYFGSNRSGSWQIWRLPANGSGSPQQVTTGGGMVARESADGKWLYFTHFEEPGLWRRALSGGQETKISDNPPVDSQDYWVMTARGIYLLAEQGNGYELALLDPDTGKTHTVYTLKHDPSPFAGLAVTPDGKRLLFAELARAESNITLVDHFQ
jgi:Tol biopolymer transport system component/DNA-binding winged helix-turn-helix (wHTH) protein